MIDQTMSPKHELSLEKLAHIIAQADFIWELGETGVMAYSPDIVSLQFNKAYNNSKKQKYLHIAQAVSAFYSTPISKP